MSHSQEQVIHELEEALLERARHLADEYLARARRARQHILEEAQEKLHLREQQATVRAQADAERFYRRQVQASELDLRKRLDQLRWQLIQSVLESVSGRLEQYAERDPGYRHTLAALTRQAADCIERERLVAEFNERDRKMLQGEWEAFVESLECGKAIRLHEGSRACSGGVLVRSEDNRIRMDNTFEGRMERLEMQVLQVVTERLFAAEVSQRGLLNE